MKNNNHVSHEEALAIFTVIAPLYCQRLPLVLKVSEIARILKVDRKTINSWIEAGQFIPETAPGHYSTPTLLYWLIKNQFPNKLTEDRLADEIAAEAVLNLSKEMMR